MSEMPSFFSELKRRNVVRMAGLYLGGFGVPFTPALLRLAPAFDSLRGDPRFEKLCQASR